MNEPQTGEPPLSAPILRAPPPRRRPLWRTLLWIGAVIVIAIIAAVLLTPHAAPPASGAGGGSGRGGGAGSGGGGRRAPTVVGVATAALGDIPIQVTALGAVTPQASVIVHTRITGTLMGVYYTEGQSVRAGQLLAQVDPRPYQVALEQAEGQLLHDQAALDEARIDLARYQTLAAQDSIAKQQVDLQAATVKQDEGTVKSDQGAVDNDKLNLIYCRITAPVSGRVGLRQVDPGNIVQISDANGVVIINQVDPTTVEFSVPEDDIPQIAARMQANGTLPVTALDRTGTTTLAQGVLYTLDNQIDPTTGTVKARARFANPTGALFASQFVNVTVLVDTLHNAVTIPAVAVRHGPQGDFVYVIQLDSTVKVTPVKVGPAQGETTAIDSGLSVGDQVVTDGGDRLSDGSTVILPQDAAAMAAKMSRQPKATGILGWIEGLFGKKPAAQSQAASGAAESSASGYGGGGGGSSNGRHGQGGRMMAMIGQLDLTPDQKTKARDIFAAARAKAIASDDPDARRAAMQDAMSQLMAILTPDQKAKLAQLRAEQAAGGGSAAPPAAAAPSVAPAPAAESRAAGPGDRHRADSSASAAPPPAAPPPASNATGGGGGAGGGGGGRLAMLTDALDLDAGQQAKAAAIFAAARAKAEGSDDPDARHAAMQAAMAQLDAILRPDQQAKLAALRAARANGSGGAGGGH